MNADRVTKVLQDVATRNGLDPSRLTMRSCRSGSSCQLGGIASVTEDAANAYVTQQHGNWAGNTGQRIYQDRLLAARKALALYSVGPYTFDHLRMLYMTTLDDDTDVDDNDKSSNKRQRRA